MTPKKVKKALKKCFVPQCNNSSINTPDKCFLIVPTDENCRRTWCAAARCSTDVLRLRSHICEDHFDFSQDLDNYNMWRFGYNRKVLKADAYPRYFEWTNADSVSHQDVNDSDSDAANLLQESPAETLPESSPNQRFQIENSNEKREHLDVFPVDRYVQTEVEFSDKWTPTKNEKEDFKRNRPMISQLCQTDSPEPSECFCHQEQRTNDGINLEKVNQVKKDCDESIESRIMSLDIQGDNTLESSGEMRESNTSNATTTDPSLKMEILKNKIFESSTSLICEDNPLLFLGIPQHAFYVIELLSTTSGIIKRDIFLVLKKIRLNLCNAILAYDFGLSEAQVSRISTSSLPIMANLFRQLISWPKKELILQNLPLQFRLRYSNVQSIIDCFEIHIEHPTNAVNQALSWSDYKKGNTAKYLISITPDGLINFISRGYTGRSSDTAIVEHSGYLTKLPDGTAVLADRGFKQIEVQLQRKHCKLIRPPSVAAGEKSTKEDVRLTKQIASVRIHVERVIRRLREFKFLESHIAVDHNCLKYLDGIVIIAAGLVNLQSKIIA